MAGFLLVAPAGREIPGFLKHVAGNRSVAHGGANHLVVPPPERGDQGGQGREINHGLGADGRQRCVHR